MRADEDMGAVAATVATSTCARAPVGTVGFGPVPQLFSVAQQPPQLSAQETVVTTGGPVGAAQAVKESDSETGRELGEAMGAVGQVPAQATAVTTAPGDSEPRATVVTP
jgi:hypothetical protein